MIYLFGLISVLTGSGVLFFKHPMRCAISMLFSMISIGGIYACLDAHLIAAFQVLIYAGAIMVLIIYIMMLLNIKGEDFFFPFNSLKIAGIVVGLFLCFLIIPYIYGIGSEELNTLFEKGSVEYISSLLTSSYILHVEIASTILLAGIIAIIALINKHYKIKENNSPRSANGI